MGFDSKRDFAPLTFLLGLLFCPWMWGISLKLLQHHAAAVSVPTILLGLLCPWTWIISSQSLQSCTGATPVPHRFIKDRGTRGQIANIHWIIKETRVFQKNIYFCFLYYAKAFDCVNHNKLLKILKEMGIPDHLTCLLRNLYAGQEATVRTGHGTTNWFQIGK